MRGTHEAGNGLTCSGHFRKQDNAVFRSYYIQVLEDFWEVATVGAGEAGENRD